MHKMSIINSPILILCVIYPYLHGNVRCLRILLRIYIVLLFNTKKLEHFIYHIKVNH